MECHNENGQVTMAEFNELASCRHLMTNHVSLERPLRFQVRDVPARDNDEQGFPICLFVASNCRSRKPFDSTGKCKITFNLRKKSLHNPITVLFN